MGGSGSDVAENDENNTALDIIDAFPDLPRGLRQRGPQGNAVRFRLDSFWRNLVLSVQKVSLALQVCLESGEWGVESVR